ncbi:hypothetical protein D9615_003295 [Tricholomella constricta]|uniref:NAD-dependent epimerase/dehydratase domain-containing protein n=1 Tax=Tricholomella constricta TaxID=117010 RepID=A0A8H5M851_9AGAR|nr:hypothetical protein D9615_003295 [Tricholomella constricta]
MCCDGNISARVDEEFQTLTPVELIHREAIKIDPFDGDVIYKSLTLLKAIQSPLSQFSVLQKSGTNYVANFSLPRRRIREDRQRFDITVLIRGEDRAALIREKLGLKTVVADLSDRTIVTAAAENADVVINTANADHPEGASAIVEGLKNRKAKTGKLGTYIHISGTGALTDKAEGEFADDKVYDDEHVEDIKAIPVDYVHRACDTLISNAGEAGDIRSYIVMPPMIYGRGTGPFHQTSVQIPALIRGALKAGQSCYYGKGIPLWNAVHVQDLTNLVLLLLDDALSSAPKAPNGGEGFYFCGWQAAPGRDQLLKRLVTISFQWKQLAQEIGNRLHSHGALPTAETRSFTEQEAGDALGTWAAFAYGSNSRSKAIKAHKLGWKPAHGDGNDGLFESIITEYKFVLEEGRYKSPIVHFDEMYALSGKK